MIIKARLTVSVKCGTCKHEGTETGLEFEAKSKYNNPRCRTHFKVMCKGCTSMIGSIVLEDCQFYFVWKSHSSCHNLDYIEEYVEMIP